MIEKTIVDSPNNNLNSNKKTPKLPTISQTRAKWNPSFDRNIEAKCFSTSHDNFIHFRPIQLKSLKKPVKNTRNNAAKMPNSDNTHSKNSLHNEEKVANE